MCEASDVQLIHGGKLLSDDIALSALGVWRDASVVHCVRRSILKKAAAENALMRSSSARAQAGKAQSPEDERRFQEALEARRLRVKPVQGDGNCMFRSIADQIYADEEMHAVTREMCMDYMEQNRVHFEQFIANEEFPDYIARKRSDVRVHRSRRLRDAGAAPSTARRAVCCRHGLTAAMFRACAGMFWQPPGAAGFR
jgi:hypothetical protein